MARRGRGAELNALRKKKKNEKNNRTGSTQRSQSSVSKNTNRDGGGRTGGLTRQQVKEKVKNAPGYSNGSTIRAYRERYPSGNTNKVQAQQPKSYSTRANTNNRSNSSRQQNNPRRNGLNTAADRAAERSKEQERKTYATAAEMSKARQDRQHTDKPAPTAKEMIAQRKAEIEERERRLSYKKKKEQDTNSRMSQGGDAMSIRRKRTKDFAKEDTDVVTDTIKKTGGASKKGAVDTASGYAQTTLDTMSALTSDEDRNYTWLRAAELSEGIDNKEATRKAAKAAVETSKEYDEKRRELNEKQEQRQAEWDKKTKDDNLLQKSIYGAAESGTGMLIDQAVGALTGLGIFGSLGSMAIRTYGTTRGQAEKEGATESEDRLYAGLQAAKEVATELMFPGYGLAKGYVKSGGMKLGESIANAATRNLRGKGADATYALLRMLGGVTEENVEEATAWGLDPLIKEFAYGKNVRNRAKAQLLSDMPEPTSREEAEALNARLNSDSFIDELAAEYTANGMPEKAAKEYAKKMRDLYSAYYAGDEEAVDILGDEVAGELTGAKKVTKESYSTSELIQTLASTTLLTATTGLPGAVTTAERGDMIKNAIGEEGMKALAKAALNAEDKDTHKRGEVAKTALDAGRYVTSTQVYELEQGIYRQQAKDIKRQGAQLDTAGKQISSNRYVTPFAMNEYGQIVHMEEATVKAYNEAAYSAESAIKDVDTKQSLTDTDVVYGARAIAGFKTGAFTIDDANAIVADDAVKQAFSEQTGIDLSQYNVRDKNGDIDIPKTNAAIKDALFAMAADNLVKMAEVETANWMDTARGETVRQVTARMGSKGSVAVQLALDDMDERDATKYRGMAVASDYIYQSALNVGVPWEDAKESITSQFSTIPESKLQMLYEAGLADRAIANDKMLGLQANIGEAMSKEGERAEDPTKGKCLVETKETPKGTTIRVFSDIAANLGVNIHLVDNLPVSKDSDRQANGQYIDGEIYINVNSKFEDNLGFIFMHEVTHHLKKYAPEQYKALENLVRESWFKYNPEQMQSKIAETIKAYEKATNGKQVLTEEEALEEIIADATHEFLRDKSFSKKVANENPSLAKAVLDSIREMLHRLRQIFSSGKYEDSKTYMNSFFSQIGILDEAERLWLEAYTEAVKNKAAVGLVEWQEEANKSERRNSIAPAQDSEGNELSEGQREYFRNSKAVDKDGNLAVVYHTTDEGGFTIFDPWYSDDKRSLFFASNFSVSQTYAPESASQFDFDENAKFDSWQDFDAFARQAFGLSESDSLAREFDISVRDAEGRTPYNLGTGVDAMFNSWLKLAESKDPKASQYTVSMTNPYTGKRIQAKVMRSLLNKLERVMITHGQTSGYYACYLNLENPLIVDAKGSYWNQIPFEEEEGKGEQKYKTRKLAEIAQNRGYDGVIIRNCRDLSKKAEFKGDDVLSDIYVAFDSNQVKDVRNQNPTEDEDIRYSIAPETRADIEEKGVDITESGTAVKYSLTSWNDTDRDALLNNLVKAGFEESVAKKWISDVDSVAATIYGDLARLNYEADRYQDALKPNSEYFYTLDLSTLCQKRRLYQGTYNAIMHRLVNVALQPKDTVRLREMMEEMNLETPCGICYEESRKKNEGKFADTWLNGETDSQFNQRMKNYQKTLENYKKKVADYEKLSEEDKAKKKSPKEPTPPERWMGYANMEHDDPYVPTLADVTTTDGRAKLREEHPDVLEAYLDYQKGRGSANPKVSFTHTDYRGDILRMTKTDVDNVKHIGGLRIQSFSDFETVHVIDMMQAIMDMASMKLTSQAYTKVPAFADIFGGTGVKINLSLIQKMDENGNPVYEEYIDEETGEKKKRLVFDSKEGIDPEEAFRLREKYPENVGTILVGVSEEQIRAAWDDPRVDMVIPFHRSGWAKDEFERLGLVGYEDFQEFQSERHWDEKEKKWISLKDAKMEELYSIDYWDKNLSGKENAKKYLKKCAELHRRPVFFNFLTDNGDGTWSLPEDGSADGYWKSLIDFKMYDNKGKYAPQQEVKPVFDMEAAQKAMDAYEGNADTLPVNNDVVEAYLKDFKKRHPRAKLNFDGDARLSISVELDDQYMSAVNSGNMEEAQKLVDQAAKEAGYTEAVYHGTYGTLFNRFLKPSENYTRSGNPQGFIYASPSEEYASYYAINPMTGLEDENGFVLNGFIKTDGALEIGTINDDVFKDTDNKFSSLIDWREFTPEEIDRRASDDMVNIAKAVGLKPSELLATLDDNIYVNDFCWNVVNTPGYAELIEKQGYKTIKVEEQGFPAYGFREPSQFKSSDAITYAEDGSVIPLSQRFDPNNDDIRFSLPTQDSDGNVLTDGVMEYFKNSQARDEQGRLVPVYHGTQNGGFTIFDSRYGISSRCFFFVDSMSAAKGYSGSEEMFSESVAGEEDMRLNYKVYLDMVSPLIVDAQGNSWADIPYEDDFVTTNWLAEYAEAEGYDGVIVKNVIDRGSADTEYAPQTDYIVFNSHQIKDVNNENPTENPDIRYSIPPEEEVKAYVSQTVEDINDIPLSDPALERNRLEHMAAEDDFVAGISESWEQRILNLDKRMGKTPLKNNLIGIMKQVRKGSKTDRKYKTETLDETVKSIKSMYKLARKNKTEAFARTAWEAAERIVNDIDYNDALYQEYKEIKEFFDSTMLAPGELWGDREMQSFANANSGKMRFTYHPINALEGDEVGIDQAYRIMRNQHPNFFPDETSDPIEQLMQMQAVLDNTDAYRDAYSSEEHAKLVDEVASNLCNIVSEGKEFHASIGELNVNAMKLRHEEALRKVTERRNHIADFQRDRADMWKKRYQERIKKEGESRAEKKARREHRKSFKRIEADYNKLCKWVLDPTKEKNVPEEFRKSLAEFLQTLDLQTENSKKLEKKTGRVAGKTFKMRELRDRLKDLSESGTDDNGEYIPPLFEVDENVDFILKKLADKLDKNGNTIDALDNEDIASIEVFMKLLIRNIERYKEVKLENKRAEISDIAGRSIEFLRDKRDRDGIYGKREGKIYGALDTINAASLTPIYLFDRLGPIKEMYDVLRHNGFDTYIRNEKMIMDRIREILGDYYEGSEKKPRPGSTIEKWRDNRSAQTIDLECGKTVTMSVAQMMSLYCLNKRGTQAVGHMTVGGIVVTPLQEGSRIQRTKDRLKGKRTAETSQKRVLTDADIQNIITKLTPEQIKVADQLQELMSVDMARLGNEAHRELYGYNNFNDPNYFPIKVSGNELQTDINNIGDAIEKIKSYGPAKPVTPGASKALIIDDIFTVVADHCNGMNLYNAYLVPISDFMKVLNYTHTFEDGEVLTTKDAIEQAYGKDVLKYILNLMKDVNGIKGDNRGGLEGLFNKAIGTAKKTAVFGNIRVALQQPTAIVRAAAEIDPKYFTAIRLNLISKENRADVYDEMYKYCPIALWKSWGYYDTFMGRDIEDVMMNNWSKSDVALSGLYGALDNATWSAIWQAVKKEQMDKYPDMDHKSEEFLKICGRRASEVFDKTQVVDSTFHRSDAMRSNEVAVKTFTAFMAEPTLTLNVFRAALFKASEMRKEGNMAGARKVIGRALAVLVVQAITVSAAQAFADAWRGKDPGLPWDDDDDDEKDERYWVRWYHNFIYDLIDQLHLENNMYVIKDLSPYVNFMISKGADYWGWPKWLRAVMGWDQDYLYSQNNLIFAALENTANGVAQVFKKLEKGEDYDKSWYDIIQKTSSGIGTFTGFPIGTLMRDTKPLWEFIIGKTFAADSELMDNVTKKSSDESSESGGKSEGTADGTGESESKAHWYDNERLGVEKGTTADKVLSKFGMNKTGLEREADAIIEKNERIEDLGNEIKGKVDDKTGEEQAKASWRKITEGVKDIDGQTMSDLIANGDYNTIDKYRDAYIAAVGNADYFDERVFAESKKAMKKAIVYDPTTEQRLARDNIRAYLAKNGMSAEEISELAYKSETKKDLAVAMRIGDKEAIEESARALVQAGLSREDFEKVYENRNRVNLEKYKKNNGRYADKLKSMGTFIWPTEGVVTSHFGYRNAPTAGASSNHPAIDIGASQGTPVVAADGGVVIYTGHNGGYGNSVGIKHDNGMVTYYNHLYSYNVKQGDTVSQGQQIAQVGSTGISTGPHLDFKILDTNGKPVDPEKYLQ